MQALLVAQGDAAEARDGALQRDWRLMADVADYHPACAKVLEGLLGGLAAGCGRQIALGLQTAASGRPPFTWTVC